MTSALPPTADISGSERNVGYGPITDMLTCRRFPRCVRTGCCVASPDPAAKPAKMRLPRYQNDARHGIPRNLVFALPRRFSPPGSRQLGRVGNRGWHLRERLPHVGRGSNVGAHCQHRDIGFRSRNLHGNDRRLAGIINDAFRPFPIRVNADDRRIYGRPLSDRRCAKRRHAGRRSLSAADVNAHGRLAARYEHSSTRGRETGRGHPATFRCRGAAGDHQR